MRSALLFPLLIACSSGGDKPTFAADAAADQEPLDAGARLPFAVDDHYLPSGFMGDDAQLSLSNVECKLPRPAGAQGDCHAFEYASGGTLGWVGVFWQFGDGNWGSSPGLPIAPGARRVRWFAASCVRASEDAICSDVAQSIRFLAGINDPTLPNHDGFSITEEQQVSQDFQEFSMDLSQVTYTKVIGAFGWVMDAPPAGSVLELHLDDIRWE